MTFEAKIKMNFSLTDKICKTPLRGDIYFSWMEKVLGFGFYFAIFCGEKWIFGIREITWNFIVTGWQYYAEHGVFPIFFQWTIFSVIIRLKHETRNEVLSSNVQESQLRSGMNRWGSLWTEQFQFSRFLRTKPEKSFDHWKELSRAIPKIISDFRLYRTKIV